MNNIHDKYAQRHYETAMNLFEEGDYDKALVQMEKAIKTAPNNPDFYSMKGVFLHKMNDIIGAIHAYKEAIEVDSLHTFSHYNLGLIYMKQNKTVLAINEWKAVINVKPDDIDSIFNIGVALSHLGKRKEAIPIYQKVLSLSPEHIQAHQNLGVIYRDEGDFKKAKMHLKMLAEFDATYIEVVQEEILKCEEQEFLEGIENNKTNYQSDLYENADISVSSALIAIISDDFDKSLAICDSILQDEPENTQALIIRGQALVGLTRNSDAIACFMEILARNPETPDALFHLGNIFLGLGELEKALSFYIKIKQLDAGYPLIKENIASIESKLNQVDKDNG